MVFLARMDTTLIGSKDEVNVCGLQTSRRRKEDTSYNAQIFGLKFETTLEGKECNHKSKADVQVKD